MVGGTVVSVGASSVISVASVGRATDCSVVWAYRDDQEILRQNEEILHAIATELMRKEKLRKMTQESAVVSPQPAAAGTARKSTV